MGVNELRELEQELPAVEETIGATERDIDEVRSRFHLPEPTRSDPEREEGYNAHYLEEVQKLLEDPNAIEFSEFINEFPEMVEKITVEVFQEGSRFEKLHPKHAIALRLMLALYREIKRLDALEKQ